ncbi:hypothetical protein AGIG_G4198 [Arapaima gigas]
MERCPLLDFRASVRRRAAAAVYQAVNGRRLPCQTGLFYRVSSSSSSNLQLCAIAGPADLTPSCQLV